MIHPTRTNLLALKDKFRSVTNSAAILKARRQALIREFIAVSMPFLQSREGVKTLYGLAIAELHLSLGHEGESFVRSLQAVTGRDLGLEMTERSVMGLQYREVTVRESPGRSPEERGYDYRGTTAHLEEAIHRFESIVSSMLAVAAYESKLKRLGDEIVRVTRRVRVLEERVMPRLTKEIRYIAQYIGEREREAYYRLKRFKGNRGVD